MKVCTLNRNLSALQPSFLNRISKPIKSSDLKLHKRKRSKTQIVNERKTNNLNCDLFLDCAWVCTLCPISGRCRLATAPKRCGNCSWRGSGGTACSSKLLEWRKWMRVSFETERLEIYHTLSSLHVGGNCCVKMKVVGKVASEVRQEWPDLTFLFLLVGNQHCHLDIVSMFLIAIQA